MALLDWLNPSVISSTVSCSPACLSLSHSGSVIPKQFAKATAKLEHPTIGYDPGAKQYNYFFARHGAPSARGWDAAVNGVVTRLEEELRQLKDVLSNLQTGIDGQITRTDRLDSDYAALLLQVGEARRLAPDDTRITKLVEDSESGKAATLALKSEFSGLLECHKKEIQERVEAMSNSSHEMSDSLHKYNKELRREAAAAKEALSATRDEVAELLFQSSKELQEGREHIRTALSETQSELQDIRQQLESSNAAIEDGRKAAKDYSSSVREDVISSLDKYNQALQDEIKSTKESLSTAERSASESLVKLVDEVRKEYDHIRQEINDTQLDVHKLRQDLTDARTERTETKRMAEEALLAQTNTSTATKKFVQELRAENEAAGNILTETQQELKDLRKQLDDVQSESSETHRTSEAYGERVKELETQLHEVRRALADSRMAMEESTKAARQGTSTIQQEVAASAARSSKELREENDAIRKELAIARSELQELRKEVHNEKNDSEERFRTVTSHIEDVSLVKSDIDQLRKDLSRQISDVQNKPSVSPEEVSGLQVKLEQLEDGLNKQREDEKDKPDASAREVSVFKNELAKLQERIAREVEDKQSNLASANEHVSAMKEELQQLKEELARKPSDGQLKSYVSVEDFESLAKAFRDVTSRISQVEPLQMEVQFLRRRLRDWDLGSVITESEIGSTVFSYDDGNGSVPGTPRPDSEHKKRHWIQPRRSIDNMTRTSSATKRTVSSDHRSPLMPNPELARDGKIKKRPTRRDPKRVVSTTIADT